MNKEYVILNLREAKEELDRTIEELEAVPDYDYGEFVVAMSHLYHHLNTAWNAQDASKEATQECSEEDFAQWRRFPDEESLLLVS